MFGHGSEPGVNSAQAHRRSDLAAARTQADTPTMTRSSSAAAQLAIPGATPLRELLHARGVRS